MTVRTLVALSVVLVGAAPAGAAPRFSAHVDNPWFPLKPGTRYVYTGEEDAKPTRDVVTVTRRTKIVDGARCVVVDDRVYTRGALTERTRDWYTQDARGNVWYFGEDTVELAHGKVTSREGSWAAGVHGARAGIFMPAHPRVGFSARQEYYRGHAEDRFRVIAIFGGNAALTEETSRLEPGVVDHKLYVRGVGTVMEQTERGGNERLELTSVTRR